MSVVIHPPNADKWPETFNVDAFMGTWYVTHSTLPLWKSRKDVTITYEPLKSSPSSTSKDQPVKFLDIVEYRSEKSDSSSSRTRIEGVDTAIPAPEASSTSDAGPPTRYKWRGKGWLMIASSKWQILGYDAGDEASGRPAWALTFFEKTLFTPAGLDIYSRTPGGLPEELVNEIFEKAQAVEGNVGELALKFFDVARSQAAAEP